MSTRSEENDLLKHSLDSNSSTSLTDGVTELYNTETAESVEAENNMAVNAGEEQDNGKKDSNVVENEKNHVNEEKGGEIDNVTKDYTKNEDKETIAEHIKDKTPFPSKETALNELTEEVRRLRRSISRGKDSVGYSTRSQSPTDSSHRWDPPEKKVDQYSTLPLSADEEKQSFLGQQQTTCKQPKKKICTLRCLCFIVIVFVLTLLLAGLLLYVFYRSETISNAQQNDINRLLDHNKRLKKEFNQTATKHQQHINKLMDHNIRLKEELNRTAKKQEQHIQQIMKHNRELKVNLNKTVHKLELLRNTVSEQRNETEKIAEKLQLDLQNTQRHYRNQSKIYQIYFEHKLDSHYENLTSEIASAKSNQKELLRKLHVAEVILENIKQEFEVELNETEKAIQAIEKGLESVNVTARKHTNTHLLLTALRKEYNSTKKAVQILEQDLAKLKMSEDKVKQLEVTVEQVTASTSETAVQSSATTQRSPTKKRHHNIVTKPTSKPSITQWAPVAVSGSGRVECVVILGVVLLQRFFV